VKITAGTRFGHYAIVSPLGTGGMGEVYLAEDTRLGRRVALKVLPSKFTSDEDRLHRFEREARAASALNHPNIITIYEIGEVENTRFIATEFVEGLTITQKSKGRPIGAAESVDIIIQAAGALQAAHRAGIIHRDVKSENIMVRTDGYVKVLDFGLAKLTEAFSSGDDVDPEAETRRLNATSPGMIMGTVSYMSPEQARGFRVDARSDIFSLGVVFYEMLTGRLPFPGDSASDIIAAILNQDAEPLRRHLRDVPDDLEWIVRKMLAKDRSNRWQSASDVIDALKGLTPQLDSKGFERRSSQPMLRDSGENVQSSSSTSRKSGTWSYDTNPVELNQLSGLRRLRYRVGHLARRGRTAILVVGILLVLAALAVSFWMNRHAARASAIAVIPFVNLSADPSTGEIADGITQGLIKSLSRLPKLRVRPLVSVLRYRVDGPQGSSPDPRAIGTDLDVPVILTGRVGRRNGGVSIDIELVDTQDNSYIWGRKYERNFSDILALHEEITREVSHQLRLDLDEKERRQLEAFQAYLRGRYFLGKRTTADVKQGIESFEAAIQRDPSFGLAHAGLADAYNILATYGVLAPADGFPKAKEEAEKALGLDARLAEAHTALAYVRHRYEWDWDGAESEFKNALELDPDYGPARQWYSSLLAALGRTSEAIAQAKRCQEIDPLSMIATSHLAWILYLSGEYEQAIEQCRKLLEKKSDFFPALRYMGLAQEGAGNLAAAIDSLERARELSGKSQVILGALGHAEAVAGNRARARELLEELKTATPDGRFSAYEAAVIHSGLADRERAFEWLGKALAERNEYLNYLLVDPRFKNLRHDKRYTDLIVAIGLGHLVRARA
jgi:eukaryotic-like serine/threonine-protein kinase